MWEWSSKEVFLEFVGRNQAPAIQAYMSTWTKQHKLDVVGVIREMLDEDFPDTDTFKVPMTANIVVGRKP
jgi:hypothetical protein